jgi:PAS domain-containing protein
LQFVIAIFVADTVTNIDIAVAVLYVAVVLMAARFCKARGVVMIGAGCVGLTVLSNFLTPPGGDEVKGIINTAISIATIGLTTVLALQGQLAEARLREQASLLDLTHDTILSRGLDDAITYWNRGAAELYGWNDVSDHRSFLRLRMICSGLQSAKALRTRFQFIEQPGLEHGPLAEQPAFHPSQIPSPSTSRL